MWARLGRWLMWSVLFALTPFVAVVLLRGIDSGSLPPLTLLFGSGQLMLTCAALLGNGIRELAALDRRSGPTEFLIWAAAVFLFLIAASYGYAVKEIVISGQVSRQDPVTKVSLVFLGFSLLVAASSIAVSTPRSEEVH
jgi:hypothetical protein